MKRFFQLISIGFLMNSCNPAYQPRTIAAVSIQEFKMKSISIRAIVGIDENTAYFAGSRGATGYTKDSGKSWTTEYLSHQDSIIPAFRSLATNGTAFFALSIGNPALLYKITTEKTELVYTEEDTNVFYDALQFFDANHGIAIGDPTGTCMSVITTKDGGNTWNKVPCEQLPEVAEGEAAFAASNTNIAIVGSTVWFASGGMKSRIYKSEDYGSSWEVFDTPVAQANPTKGIYSIDFADANFGVAIGGDYLKPSLNTGNKAATTDGGKTWHLMAEGQNPNYKSCIQFVPETNGTEIFAVGVTGISFSNDRGKTWQQVSDEPYYAIDFVDKNTAWLSGAQKIGKLVLNK